MSPQEIECVRRVVYAEARGEPLQGQYGVAATIVNRAKRNHQSLCNISQLRHQYITKKPSKGFSFTPKDYDPTHGATSFERKDSPPFKHLKKYITIGNHTFYGK